MRIPKSRIHLGLLALFILGAGCSLDVGPLPVNEPPVVGEILIDPAALAPQDTLTLSVDAGDPDGDELNYSWSAGGHGQWWGEAGWTDSLVQWIVPANLGGIESITFTVNVFDYNIQNAVSESRTLFTEERSGSLLVRLVGLDGQPAFAVQLEAVGVDTLTADEPSDSFLFDALPWGNQAIVNVQTEDFYGSTALWPGRPETLNVRPDTLITTTLVLAPRTLVLIPGVVGEGLGDQLLSSPQQGIAWAEAEGLDSVLLRRRDYSLDPQPVPGGTAALVLGGRDLLLAPFPGEEPIWLNAGELGCDYGFHLSGRSEACRIEDLAMIGAGDAGILLSSSGGSFSGVRLADCGSKGITFQGGAGDLLRFENGEILGGEYGLWQEGGAATLSGCLIAGCSWYGLRIAEGGEAALDALTLVDHQIAGLITHDAGTVTLERSIVAGCITGAFTHFGGSPALSCNIFWNNGENLNGVPQGGDFLVDDPLFCDGENSDWRVDAASPALSAPCGPLGALGDCDSPDSPYAGGP